jgi:hypothetical protein
MSGTAGCIGEKPGDWGNSGHNGMNSNTVLTTQQREAMRCKTDCLDPCAYKEVIYA